MLSGTAIAFAAFVNIIWFLTDILGFLLIFPISRKLILNVFIKKFKHKKQEKTTFIEGEFEDIEDNDDSKI